MSRAAPPIDLELARHVASTVLDPELPVLSLADLGVLREVVIDDNGTVVVTITPTYSGCPAMATMRADLKVKLRAAGFEDVDVRTVLHPAWSTDWISRVGRQLLFDYGISPPGPAPREAAGPIALTLTMPARLITCPQCGSGDTRETSAFGSTACKSLHQCQSCGEPFDHVKEI